MKRLSCASGWYGVSSPCRNVLNLTSRRSRTHCVNRTRYRRTSLNMSHATNRSAIHTRNRHTWNRMMNHPTDGNTRTIVLNRTMIRMSIRRNWKTRNHHRPSRRTRHRRNLRSSSRHSCVRCWLPCASSRSVRQGPHQGTGWASYRRHAPTASGPRRASGTGAAWRG